MAQRTLHHSHVEADRILVMCLTTLYGQDVYDRWRERKLKMKFKTEREYVIWLLDLADKYVPNNTESDVGHSSELEHDAANISLGDEERITAADDLLRHRTVKVPSSVSEKSSYKRSKSPLEPSSKKKKSASEDREWSVIGLNMFAKKQVEKVLASGQSERPKRNIRPPPRYNEDEIVIKEEILSDDETGAATDSGDNEDEGDKAASTVEAAGEHVIVRGVTTRVPWRIWSWIKCMSCEDVCMCLRDHFMFHMREHHPEEEEYYACTECEYITCVEQHIEDHKTIVHPLPLAYKCPICERIFNNDKSLVRHIQDNHTISDSDESIATNNIVKFPQPRSTQVTKQGAKYQKAAHHNSEKSDHEFNNPIVVVESGAGHKNDYKKDHQNQGTSRQSSMKVKAAKPKASTVTNSLKAFVCNMCNEGFMNPDELEEHFNSKHIDNEESNEKNDNSVKTAGAEIPLVMEAGEDLGTTTQPVIPSPTKSRSPASSGAPNKELVSVGIKNIVKQPSPAVAATSSSSVINISVIGEGTSKLVKIVKLSSDNK